MPLLKTIAVILAAALVALGARWLMLGSHDGSSQQAAEQTIGGPFTLVDSTGKTVTDKDFHGKYMLVYFGYTYCPDVCPTSLQTIAQGLDGLPAEKAAKIVPVFISVDPDRDTPKLMGDYVKSFYPTMRGLTGSKEQVKAAAKAYRVYYAKVEEKGAPPQDYLMDHSALSYLMDPDGAYITYFNHDTTPEEMTKKLASLIK